MTSARQALPDQIRGWALLGIVVVNVSFLGVSSDGFTNQSIDGWWNQLAAFAVLAFAQGKFFLIFSFMFGYSLQLLLEKLDRAGTARYALRLVGLGALGFAHATMLFWGDILLTYAICGLVLLLIARRSDRFVLRVGVGFAVLAVALIALVTADGFASPNENNVDARYNESTQAYESLDDACERTEDSLVCLDAATFGTFGEARLARTELLGDFLFVYALISWPNIIAMFCFGLLAGRHNLLDGGPHHDRLWKWFRRIGLFVGLPLGVLSGLLEFGPGTLTLYRDLWGFGVGYVAAPLLSMGYLALAHRWRDTRAFAWAAPGGQISLSSYLGASILLNVVFAGWGLGWLGEVSALEAVVIGIAVWFVLQLAARVWLRTFQIGPFEWLLRSWTYLRPQKLRR